MFILSNFSSVADDNRRELGLYAMFVMYSTIQYRYTTEIIKGFDYLLFQKSDISPLQVWTEL